MTWKKTMTAAAEGRNAPPLAKLLEQYSGPIQFNGTGDALFEQHLTFDNVADATEVGVAPAVRGARTVDAGYPLPALAPHAANLRSREPQAHLLSFPGVPDRPVAGQQHPQPAPRSRCPAHRRRQEARLDGHSRGGTRRRPRQWRARPPRGVLPRFDGNDAAPGDGLRAALRVRHFPPDHRERLATRAPGQLAATPRSLGGRPAAGDS